MADAPDDTLTLERAKERVLEDERMRSDLADDEAQPLLDWAMAELESASARGEPMEAAVDRVRAKGRVVNDLVGQRQTLDRASMDRQLRAFAPRPALSPRRAGGPPSDDAVARLAADAGSMDGPSFVRAVLALLTTPAAAASASSGRPRTGLLLALVLLVLGAALVAVVVFGFLRPRQTTTTQPPPSKPSAGPTLDGLVSVYFTEPLETDRPADRRPSLDEKLTAFLKESTTSVDMAIYDLDLDNVTNALLDANQRGVKVRLVTDTDNLKNDAIVKLQAAKIPVIEDKRSAIMHDKFAVVDRNAVWMGSWNFTDYDTFRYNNNGALWRSKPLAEIYVAEFEKLFAGQFGARARTAKPAGEVVTDETRGVRIEAHFTPEDDPEPIIVKRVQEAQRSIVFMAYSYTSDPIGKAMREAATRGVKVRGVFEKTGTDSANSPSEYRPMKEAGLDVLQDGNRYLMHHKVIVIDDRTVIFGSYNFSANAQDNNENLLIVESPELAKLFTQEFERVYARAAAAK